MRINIAFEIFCLLISIILTSSKNGFFRASVPCYGLVYDGGSSSTKLNIFNWDCRTEFKIPEIQISSDIPVYKVSPGIASFADNIGGIEAYLQPIITQGIESVPIQQRSYTPIMFGGTAGLRTLTSDQQNAIIKEVTRILSETGLLFNNTNNQWCRVLEGREEGAFMWLTVNYILGTIQKGLLQPFNTFTTIDLGGASTQISFVPRPPLNMSTEKTVTLTLPNVNEFPLFAETYLGYGNDLARASIVENYSDQWTDLIYENSCFFKGYVGSYEKNPDISIYGKGDLLDCIANIQKFLNNNNCKGNDIDHCGINNSHYTPAPTTLNTYALNGANFGAAAIGALDKEGKYTLSTYYSQLNAYAAQKWSQVSAENPENSLLYTMFFLATYNYVLLLEGYQLTPDQTIYSPAKIGSVTPTWAMGMILDLVGNQDCQADSPDCTKNLYFEYQQ